MGQITLPLRDGIGMTAELIVADVGAWRRWLSEHGFEPEGVWLVLAKKGTTDPTSLTYDQALDEAPCHGWIDGQLDRRNTDTYRRASRRLPCTKSTTWFSRTLPMVSRMVNTGLPLDQLGLRP